MVEVLLGLMSAFHAHHWMFKAFSSLLLSCTFPTLAIAAALWLLFTGRLQQDQEDGNGVEDTVDSDGGDSADSNVDEGEESVEEKTKGDFSEDSDGGYSIDSNVDVDEEEESEDEENEEDLSESEEQIKQEKKESDTGAEDSVDSDGGDSTDSDVDVDEAEESEDKEIAKGGGAKKNL